MAQDSADDFEGDEYALWSSYAILSLSIWLTRSQYGRYLIHELRCLLSSFFLLPVYNDTWSRTTHLHLCSAAQPWLPVCWVKLGRNIKMRSPIPGASESLGAGTLRALPAASGPAASMDSAGRQNKQAAFARTGSAAPSGLRRAHSPDRSTAVSMEGVAQPPFSYMCLCMLSTICWPVAHHSLYVLCVRSGCMCMVPTVFFFFRFTAGGR